MYIYILLRRNVYVFLGGGFNYFLFSFLFGEDGLKPPTRDQIHRSSLLETAAFRSIQLPTLWWTRASPY